MPRRSTPQAKTDDHRFPVRVKFVVPGNGLSQIAPRFIEDCCAWLQQELGGGEWAWHSAGLSVGRQATAIYFRTPAAAQRFVEAFPEFELADGVVS